MIERLEKKSRQDATDLSTHFATPTSLRVGVVGLGYVGLPLFLRLVDKGFNVIGVEIAQSVLDAVTSGRSWVEGIDDSDIQLAMGSGRASVVKVGLELNSDSLKALFGLDVIVVCVPTPLREKRGWSPETSSIVASAQLLCRLCELERESNVLPKHRLIILESTTYPGTTSQIFAPLHNLFRGGEHELFLAYSPERTSPGPESHKADSPMNTFKIPRIVAGADRRSLAAAEGFYGSIFDAVHPVSSLEAAEMTKLVENTFRFVSIGFANEIARIAAAFNLDVWEIISAAKTKGFGLDICYPGLIGGHCLPIDPHYLNWAYRNHRNSATFVEVAERSHQDARRSAVDIVQRGLSRVGKSVFESSIVFFGVAYKADVGDIRESGSVDLMKKLFGFGASVSFWDPIYSSTPVSTPVEFSFTDSEVEQMPASSARQLVGSNGAWTHRPKELHGNWEQLRQEIMSGFDCVVLAANHRSFRETYSELLLRAGGPILIDINNALGSSATDLSEAETSALENRAHYLLFGRD